MNDAMNEMPMKAKQMPDTTSAPRLLEGITVLDMSQFLSGPLAALRLADFGAEVIKIERPDGGDLCRRLYLSDTEIGGESTLFHAINRGKKSFAADLKTEIGLDEVRRLAARADVVIQNFRPGVIERLGLDYATLAALNPRLVYGSITGYGTSGPWVARPGQDLLAQARSGLMWLNGDADQGPVPFGLAVADILAGHTLAEGILAGLVRRGITGLGVHIETSLLEALVDLQFEVLTTYLNDGGRVPKRGNFRSAHAYLAAPYGVYATSDGWLAIAMAPLSQLAGLLDLPDLGSFDGPRAFAERDSAKTIIAGRVREQSTSHWLAILEPRDIWCAEVLDWPRLLESDAFRRLDMLQDVVAGENTQVRTTRPGFRLDGQRPGTAKAAPRIGEHTEDIRRKWLEGPFDK